jgi:UDP-N-acetylmuramyl tripeptide synthase
LYAAAHPAQRRILVVAGRGDRDHPAIARPEAVAEHAVEVRALVAVELVDERQRRDDAIRRVDVGREDADAAVVGRVDRSRAASPHQASAAPPTGG